MYSVTKVNKKSINPVKKSDSIFKEYKDFQFQWHFNAETGELTFINNQLNNK